MDKKKDENIPLYKNNCNYKLYMSNFFKIKFSKPIIQNIDTLYFIENNNVIYYDGSHMNYIFIDKYNDIEYTFYGYYKNEYLIIYYDSYNKELDIKIEHKNVILIKLQWIKKEIKEKEIFVLNNDKNILTNAIIVNIRKKINNNINIDDYLKLYDYEIIKVYINHTFNEKKNNIIKIIKSFF